jgi:hypothetical protein
VVELPEVLTLMGKCRMGKCSFDAFERVVPLPPGWLDQVASVIAERHKGLEIERARALASSLWTKGFIDGSMKPDAAGRIAAGYYITPY